jgi:uncharacterized membrane protein YqgA involved in biofilm formation
MTETLMLVIIVAMALTCSFLFVVSLAMGGVIGVIAHYGSKLLKVNSELNDEIDRMEGDRIIMDNFETLINNVVNIEVIIKEMYKQNIYDDSQITRDLLQECSKFLDSYEQLR